MSNRILVVTGLLVALASPLAGKEIHWNELAVSALLHSDGTLTVTERHDMVFDGGWNGGERVVDVRKGQSLTVHAVHRISEDGGRVPLTRGDLSVVDNWQQMGDAIRWRSRNPSDPPFDNRRLIYEIRYTLNGVLSSKGDGYVLDHEFVPTDRAGAIATFKLQFDTEEPWKTDAGLPLQRTATALAPSDGYQLELQLERADGSSVTGVRRSLTAFERTAGIAALLAGCFGSFILWRKYELRTGRLNPLPVVSGDDAAAAFADWRPEVLGAAWDEDVGAAEVAAVLARVESEGKIRSSVDGESTLEMELLVPRESLHGYDRALIDGLFVEGDRTSTAKVKEHYKSTGFNPAGAIREGINDELAKHADWSADRARFGCFLGLLPWLGGVFLAALFAVFTPADSALIMPLILISLLFPALGGGVAYVIARKPAIDAGLTVAWNIVPVIGITAAAALIAFTSGVSTLWDLIAIVVLVSFAYATVAAAARTPLSASRLKLRRWLLALRRWTESELERNAPQLRDEWMPHILALGLGSNVDRWFVNHGSTIAAPVFASRSTSPSASSSHSGPGGTWSGGGTSFGGGGATGSWVAAASTMAAGVAAPSSSSSSGGGGGGSSSSGGGSAGGW